MTLLFMEGFDKVTTAQLGSGGRWQQTANVTVSSSYARFTGQGITFGYSDRSLKKTDFLIDTYDTIVLGMAYKLVSESTPSLNLNEPQIQFSEGGTNHLKVCMNSSRQLVVYNGNGTLLGTSPYSLSPYIWYYIEFKAIIHDTTGSFELRVNENTWISDTNVDTRNGGNGYIYGLTISCPSDNVYSYIDDIYVDDSDFHGDVRIKSFLPTSDGSHLDFIASAGNRYECVDETPTHNSDTDYVSKDTLNAKQTFKFTTGALQTVKGVQLSNVLRKDNAGIVGIKNLCRSNGTDYLATNEKIPTTTYTFESDIFETDPDDSNAWTQTKLEAAEFGLQITSVP